MLFVLLSLGGGLVFLTLAMAGLVHGAQGITHNRRGVHLLLSGMFVGLGTSMPELAVSLQAAWVGNQAIAVGNVIGSNIFNLMVILGLTALVRKIKTNPTTWQQQALPLLFFTGLLAVAVALFPHPPRWLGGLGVLLWAAYGGWLYYATRTQLRQAPAALATPPLANGANLPLWANLGLVGGSMLALVFGAKLLIDAALSLAQLWNVSDSFIGLTIVAASTSLPELFASAMAAWRKQPALAVGVLLGANIFNLLGVLGLSTLVFPAPFSAVIPAQFPAQFATTDVWVLLATTAAFVLCARVGWRLSRVEGVLFLAAYALYVTYLLQYASAPAATTLLANMPFVG